MSRGLHADTITALGGDFQMAHLVKLDLDTPIYVTDYGTNVTYDSNEYLASGHLLAVDNIKETSDLRVGTTSIDLSAVEQSYVSAFLTGDYMSRGMTIYLAIITTAPEPDVYTLSLDYGSDTYGYADADAVFSPIQGTPIELFTGQIVGFSLEDGGSSSVLTVEAASHWKDFQKVAGRRTTPNSQKRFFATDEGMEFAVEQNREVVWGRSK